MDQADKTVQYWVLVQPNPTASGYLASSSALGDRFWILGETVDECVEGATEEIERRLAHRPANEEIWPDTWHAVQVSIQLPR